MAELISDWTRFIIASYNNNNNNNNNIYNLYNTLYNPWKIKALNQNNKY